MPAAHRLPRTDHPADASTPADDPTDTSTSADDPTDAASSTDASDSTGSSNGETIEWLVAAERSNARSTDGLAQPGRLLAAELECARLRARVLDLEATLEERDRERQALIDRYEHLLAERDRPSPVRRQSTDDGAVDRLRRALAAHTR